MSLNPNEQIRKDLQTMIDHLTKNVKSEADEIVKNPEIARILNSHLGTVIIDGLEKCMMEKTALIAYCQSLLNSHQVTK